MIWQDARKIFEQHLNFENTKPIAEGMIVFLDKLGPLQFFDSYDVQVIGLDLSVKIPDRNGRVLISWRDDRYMLIAEHVPLRNDPSVGTISWHYIYNLENPIPEIEEFIERVKPEMVVGWK